MVKLIFNVRLASLVVASVPIGLALTTAPASAQNAREYMYRRQLSNVCASGLKLAAGACVRRCPAGYQDMGRRCRLRNQNH